MPMRTLETIHFRTPTVEQILTNVQCVRNQLKFYGKNTRFANAVQGVHVTKVL